MVGECDNVTCEKTRRIEQAALTILSGNCGAIFMSHRNVPVTAYVKRAFDIASEFVCCSERLAVEAEADRKFRESEDLEAEAAVNEAKAREAEADAAVADAAAKAAAAEEAKRAAEAKVRDGIKARKEAIDAEVKKAEIDGRISPPVAVEPEGVSDRWKSIPIEDLDVEKSHFDLLAEAGLLTAGEVVEFDEENGLEAIKGIGQSSAEKILSAIDEKK